MIRQALYHTKKMPGEKCCVMIYFCTKHNFDSMAVMGPSTNVFGPMYMYTQCLIIPHGRITAGVSNFRVHM